MPHRKAQPLKKAIPCAAVILKIAHCRHQDAEGFESRTRPQFIDVLGTAKASAGEVRSQLYVAHDQGYLDDEKFEAVSDRADNVSRQLYHLIRHLEQNSGSERVRELPADYIAE